MIFIMYKTQDSNILLLLLERNKEWASDPQERNPTHLPLSEASGDRRLASPRVGHVEDVVVQ